MCQFGFICSFRPTSATALTATIAERLMKCVKIAILTSSSLLLFVNACISCEIMGLSFSEEASHCHLFDAFRYRSERNRDGWGVAYYADRSVQLIKEPTLALESPLADFPTQYDSFKSQLMLAHVRKASQGPKSLKNTHPFAREYGGKDWVLSRSGDLRYGDWRNTLKTKRFVPLSRIDSEIVLCYLLEKISDKEIEKWDISAFTWLQQIFREINELGGNSCLLSDGQYLFAYGSKTKGPLHFILRKPPYEIVHFRYSNQDVDLRRIYPHSAYGLVFCDVPLTDENWDQMNAGQLIVVKEGEIIFEGKGFSSLAKNRK